MNFKKLLSVVVLLIGVVSFSQNLTCKDFKEGTFYIAGDQKDSITFDIIREGNNQIEINSSEGSDRKAYAIIAWIDECTYKIKYDDSKMELDEMERFVNEHGGLLVEKIKIDGKCLYYKSSLTVDGKEMRVDGKICKKDKD